jgi:hypothetical protein
MAAMDFVDSLLTRPVSGEEPKNAKSRQAIDLAPLFWLRG